MFRFKLTAAFLAVFLIAGLWAGCHDIPVSVEDDSIELPSDKLSLEISNELPEIIEQGKELGLDEYKVTDRETDAANHGPRPVARANAVARKYLRILKSLELTDEQWIKIRHCFADYKECIESATKRYKNARRELYAEFKAKVERIKNALINGDITPERARELYKECVAEYRAKVKRLTKAYHEAIADCLHKLKRCIESVLNDRQLARWNELIGDGGGNDDGDRGEGDDKDDDGDDDDKDDRGGLGSRG